MFYENVLLNAWTEGKMNKNKERTNRTDFSIPKYNFSLKFCTSHDLSIFYGCADIFDKKCLEKGKEQIQGRINIRSALNPTIQLVVVYLYTKYDLSILKGCRDIFDKKCYGITEGRTDGRME